MFKQIYVHILRQMYSHKVNNRPRTTSNAVTVSEWLNYRQGVSRVDSSEFFFFFFPVLYNCFKEKKKTPCVLKKSDINKWYAYISTGQFLAQNEE